MTQALSALLAKLEAATGPSREYDAEIARAVGWHLRDGMYGLEWIAPEGRMRGLPHFTESLDCAMTLVPEGCYWHVAAGKTRDSEPLYGAMIQEAAFDGAELGAAENDVGPALALVIASIRARLAGQKE